MGIVRRIAASADVELITTLDEKFIANDIVFKAAHSSAVMLFAGESVRRADGSIDRGFFEDFTRTFAAGIPLLRKNLVRAPLGLTTPAWIPTRRFSPADHLLFHDTELSLSGEDLELWTGRPLPDLPMGAPMWQFVVVGLDDGRVGLLMRFHHVIGDGVFNLAGLDSMLREEPGPLPTEPNQRYGASRSMGPRPRGRLHVALVAGARWYLRQGSARAAWTEYWRKPFVKRLRRTGGRLLRPIRNREIRRRGLMSVHVPPRSSRFAILRLQDVSARAVELGCTLNDLIVAGTLVALAAEGTHEEIALLVPISRRAEGDGGVRNHISMVRVGVPRGLSLADTAALVHAQVMDAAGSRTAAPQSPDWIGYATYVPWAPGARRHVGHVPVEAFIAWPIGDPRDPVACLMTLHGEELTVALTTHDRIDIDRAMGTLVATIGPAEGAAG